MAGTNVINDPGISGVELSIPRVHMQGQVVFYEIRSRSIVSRQVFTDVLFKRYSDFYDLDVKLRKNFPKETIAELPKKKLFGNLEPKFIEQRRTELEKYIWSLQCHGTVATSVIRHSADLRAFLPDAYARARDQSQGIIRFDCTELTTLSKLKLQILIITLHRRIDILNCSSVGGLDSEDSRTSVDWSQLLPVKVSESDAGAGLRCVFQYMWDENHMKKGNDIPHVMKQKRKELSFETVDDRLRFFRVLRHIEATQQKTVQTQPQNTVSGAKPATAAAPATAATATATATAASSATESKSAASDGAVVPIIGTAGVGLNGLNGFSGSLGGDDPSGFGRSGDGGAGVQPSLRPISVLCSSWNMAKLPQQEDLSDWLPKDGGGYAIIAVGLQECTQLLNSMVTVLQKHLGPSYYIVGKHSLWEIKLIVFAHRIHLPLGTAVNGVHTESIATGMLHLLGNKGGVGVTFKVYGLSIAFVNTHLAPHDHRYDARNRMFEEINSGLKLGSLPELDISGQFDALFWLGDLNYRVENLSHQECLEMISHRKFDRLVAHDQLKRAIRTQKAFNGFSEGAINFLPTYKFLLPKEKNKLDKKAVAASAAKKPASTPSPATGNATGSGGAGVSKDVVTNALAASGFATAPTSKPATAPAGSGNHKPRTRSRSEHELKDQLNQTAATAPGATAAPDGAAAAKAFDSGSVNPLLLSLGPVQVNPLLLSLAPSKPGTAPAATGGAEADAAPSPAPALPGSSGVASSAASAPPPKMTAAAAKQKRPSGIRHGSGLVDTTRIRASSASDPKAGLTISGVASGNAGAAAGSGAAPRAGGGAAYQPTLATINSLPADSSVLVKDAPTPAAGATANSSAVPSASSSNQSSVASSLAGAAGAFTPLDTLTESDSDLWSGRGRAHAHSTRSRNASETVTPAVVVGSGDISFNDFSGAPGTGASFSGGLPPGAGARGRFDSTTSMDGPGVSALTSVYEANMSVPSSLRTVHSALSGSALAGFNSNFETALAASKPVPAVPKHTPSSSTDFDALRSASYGASKPFRHNSTVAPAVGVGAATTSASGSASSSSSATPTHTAAATATASQPIPTPTPTPVTPTAPIHISGSVPTSTHAAGAGRKMSISPPSDGHAIPLLGSPNTEHSYVESSPDTSPKGSLPRSGLAGENPTEDDPDAAALLGTSPAPVSVTVAVSAGSSPDDDSRTGRLPSERQFSTPPPEQPAAVTTASAAAVTVSVDPVRPSIAMTGGALPPHIQHSSSFDINTAPSRDRSRSLHHTLPPTDELTLAAAAAGTVTAPSSTSGARPPISGLTAALAVPPTSHHREPSADAPSAHTNMPPPTAPATALALPALAPPQTAAADGATSPTASTTSAGGGPGFSPARVPKPKSNSVLAESTINLVALTTGLGAAAVASLDNPSAAEAALAAASGPKAGAGPKSAPKNAFQASLQQPHSSADKERANLDQKDAKRRNAAAAALSGVAGQSQAVSAATGGGGAGHPQLGHSFECIHEPVANIRFKNLVRRRGANTPKPVQNPAPKLVAGTSGVLRPYGLKRFPSWCDRILWRTIHEKTVQIHTYQACENTVSSDHLPVKASFTLHVPTEPPIVAYQDPCELVLSYLCCHMFLPLEIPSNNKQKPTKAAPTAAAAAPAMANAKSDSAPAAAPQASSGSETKSAPATGSAPATSGQSNGVSASAAGASVSADTPQLYVTFYGPVLASGSRGKRTAFSPLLPHYADLPPIGSAPITIAPSAPASAPATTTGTAPPAGATDGVAPVAAAAVPIAAAIPVSTTPGTSNSTSVVTPASTVARWDDDDIPVLQCVVGLRQFVALEKIFFVIKSTGAGGSSSGGDAASGSGSGSSGGDAGSAATKQVSGSGKKPDIILGQGVINFAELAAIDQRRAEKEAKLKEKADKATAAATLIQAKMRADALTAVTVAPPQTSMAVLVNGDAAAPAAAAATSSAAADADRTRAGSALAPTAVANIALGIAAQNGMINDRKQIKPATATAAASPAPASAATPTAAPLPVPARDAAGSTATASAGATSDAAGNNTVFRRRLRRGEGDTQSSWTFVADIEKNSIAVGTLCGKIYVDFPSRTVLIGAGTAP